MAIYSYNSKTKEIQMRRGDSATLSRTVTKDGAVYDITGLEIYFTVKDKSNLQNSSDSGAKFQLNVGSGITLTTPASGEYSVAISKTNTALNPGTYSYDIQLIDGSDVHTIVTGDFTILEDVTKTNA